jgi:hypothetical protein
MTISTKKYLLALVGLLAITAYVYTNSFNVQGASFTGTVSRLDSATTTSVGPQASPSVRIFTANTECDARVISTAGSNIFISFGETGVAGNISSTTLNNNVGHLQLASTTEVYDSGLYGCGQWHAFGTASSTITVSEL